MKAFYCLSPASRRACGFISTFLSPQMPTRSAFLLATHDTRVDAPAPGSVDRIRPMPEEAQCQSKTTSLSGSTGTATSTQACRRASTTTNSLASRRKNGSPPDSTPYDPDEVPPATDAPLPPEDITQTEEWQEERAELLRQADQGEIRPVDESHPFPPTRYE